MLKLTMPTFGEDYIDALRRFYDLAPANVSNIVDIHWQRICRRDAAAPKKPIERTSELSARFILDRMLDVRGKTEAAATTATLDLMMFEQQSLLTDKVFIPKHRRGKFDKEWDLDQLAVACQSASDIAALEKLEVGRVEKYSKKDHDKLLKGGLLHPKKIPNHRLVSFVLIVMALGVILFQWGIKFLFPEFDFINLNFESTGISVKVEPYLVIPFYLVAIGAAFIKIFYKAKHEARNDPFYTSIKSVYISKLGIVFLERYRIYLSDEKWKEAKILLETETNMPD